MIVYARRFSVLFSLIIFLLFGIPFIQAQDEIELSVFVDSTSLTLHVPSSSLIAFEGVGFSVQNNGQSQTYLLQNYESFGIRFNDMITPICFRLVVGDSTSVVPQACQNVTTLIQRISNADRFWFNPVTNTDRTFEVVQDDSVLGICAAGNPSCAILFEPEILPPPPTATPGFSIDPFATFDGQNADWTPIIRDFDGAEMALVPPACFVMGSADLPDAQPNNQCIDAPYWISVTEVTNVQYAACVSDEDNEGCTPPREPYNFGDPDFDDHPIVNIDWFQARDYCEWMGGRLPNEREWEYAARGVSGWEFPWGTSFERGYVNMAGEGDDFDQSAPVGSIPEGASWVGALDMSGNVWEWTSSLYMNYPYNLGDGCEADTGEDMTVQRVMRGGAWGNDASVYMRTSPRHKRFPSDIVIGIGFRCVRDFNS